MKRIVAIIAALAMLIGVIPSVADDNGFIDTMQEVNDSTKNFYAKCIEALIAVHDAGQDSDALAICMHYYITMYNASCDITGALIMLPLSGLIPEDKTLKSGETGKTILEKYYSDEYEKYVSGEVSASEYTEKMKNMYEVVKKAQEQAQKEIDEINAGKKK